MPNLPYAWYNNNYFTIFYRTLTLVPRAQCAFVQYTTRSAAEHAAEKTFNRLVIAGKRLTIKWGKSQGKYVGLLLLTGLIKYQYNVNIIMFSNLYILNNEWNKILLK